MILLCNVHALFQIEVLSGVASEINKSSTTALKTAKNVLGLIIDRVYLSEFTWSGKSKPGTRKLALKDFPHTIELIHSIASRSHKYTKEEFRKDLVDKILKFAYE